jgi:hypothetical protein
MPEKRSRDAAQVDAAVGQETAGNPNFFVDGELLRIL